MRHRPWEPRFFPNPNNPNLPQNLSFGHGDLHPLEDKGYFCTGGNVHDTFHLDASGNISNYHTSVDLGKNDQGVHQKLRMDHPDCPRKR